MFVAFILILIIIAKLTVIFGKKQCDSKASMVGKVVIVTGANSGLGFETAKDLAARGGRVIMACRNEGSALLARDSIIKETGNADVIYKHLDLCSLESVRRFAANISQTESRLDVLVNNAGSMGDTRHSADGIIMDMQINYFAPFLLTLLLLPLLKKTKASRIVNVSSISHYFGRINLEHINTEGYYYHNFWTYANNKLCLVLFTVELARRLKGTGVTVNAVHPGFIRTRIATRSDLISQISYDLFLLTCSRSAMEGAQTIIYLAVADECANTSGKYFVDCKEYFMNPKTRDHKLTADLWNYSVKLVGLEELK